MATQLLDDDDLAKRGLHVSPEPPIMPVNKYTIFDDIRKTSYFGGLLVFLICYGAERTAKGGAAAGLGDGDAAVAVCVNGALGSSPGSLQLMTGGVLPVRVLAFLVHVLNGAYWSALLTLIGWRKVR